MKLTVLGGGGVRSPFLMKTLILNAQALSINEISLMDIDDRKLEIFAKLSKEIAQRIDSSVHVSFTNDKVEALRDADFIITTMRVGGDQGRLFDEELAQKYGILGQETTGIGGFAMALRSIPALIGYLEVAKKVAKPDVKVFNFTNPSGLVTQALLNCGFDNVYGICDGPTSFIHQLASMLGSDHKHFDTTCYGLNHLSFYRDFTMDGKDCSEEVLSHVRLFHDTEMKIFDKEIIPALVDELPNEYLYFFFNHHNVIQNIKTTGHARGYLIKDINERMIRELEVMKDAPLEDRFAVYIRYLVERENSYFAIESKGQRDNHKEQVTLQQFIDAPDEGGYSGIALNIIRGLQGKEAESMTILVRNDGHIKDLADDDVIEITCDMKEGKILPRNVQEIPSVQLHFIKTIKTFERFSVDAILEKDKGKAIKALMVHPLINDFYLAKELVDILLNEYSEHVGVWHS